MWEHPVSSISMVCGCIKHNCIKTTFYRKKCFVGWDGVFLGFFFFIKLYVRMDTQLTCPVFVLQPGCKEQQKSGNLASNLKKYFRKQKGEKEKKE